jgi:hypothetical protein
LADQAPALGGLLADEFLGNVSAKNLIHLVAAVVKSA